jgi:hypothetical protein
MCRLSCSSRNQQCQCLISLLKIGWIDVIHPRPTCQGHSAVHSHGNIAMAFLRLECLQLNQSLLKLDLVSFVICDRNMVKPRSQRILQRSSFISLNGESPLPLVLRVTRKDCTQRRMHYFWSRSHTLSSW